MKTSLRRAVVSVLALGLTLAGSQASLALTKWRQGIVPFKGDAGFFYMAKEKGFFEKHGIDLEFVEIPGNVKVVRALLANTVDGIEASPGAMFTAIIHGADIRFIGSTLPGLTYAFYAGKDIKDWPDLKGKNIGASSPGSVADIFSRVSLKNHGVDPASVEFSNAGGSSGTYIKALAQGQISGASASTEFIPVVGKMGIKVMATAAQETPLYPRLIIASTEKILQAKGRDVVANFLAAYMEGLQYAMAHRQETIDLTAKVLHQSADDPTFSFIYDEVIKEKDVSPTADLASDRVKWLYDYMREDGELETTIDLAKYTDGSYREQALKLVNKDAATASKAK